MLNDVVCQEQPISVGMQIGVIIIGRNEGERLRRAFSSIPVADVSVLYVDSGSSDGSVELARSLGIEVHSLDPARPFSPSRARVEGVSQLLQTMPSLRFIQFVDGDCELTLDWLAQAIAYLEQHAIVAIVCGLLVETAPELSIYNKLSPQTWKQRVGEIDACGGIFMIRRDIYEAIGGFNPTLITREESDLCKRVRIAGYRIERLDALMAKHDSGLLSFSQWWIRAIWGGYGDALGIDTDLGNIENRRRLRWYLTGPLAAPVLVAGGFIGMAWSSWFALAPIVVIAVHGLSFTRLAVARLRQGDSVGDAICFSAFAVLRNLACGYGFIKYFLRRGGQAKRPDPHTPQAF